MKNCLNCNNYIDATMHNGVFFSSHCRMGFAFCSGLPYEWDTCGWWKKGMDRNPKTEKNMKNCANCAHRGSEHYDHMCQMGIEFGVNIFGCHLWKEEKKMTERQVTIEQLEALRGWNITQRAKAQEKVDLLTRQNEALQRAIEQLRRHV